MSHAGDRSRFMNYLDTPISCVSPILNYVTGIMRILFPKLHAKDESLLCSKPSNMRQVIHCDYDVKTESKSLFMDSGEPPLGILIALQDQTKLLVFPKSHNYVWKILETPEGKYPRYKPITGIIVDIPRYSAIIFRQDLVHAGDAYDHVNVRLHIYLDRIDVEPTLMRERDSTFLIDQMGNRAPKYFLIPENKNPKKRSINENETEAEANKKPKRKCMIK